MTPTLTPAYGRDYRSRKAAIADLEANKDWQCNGFYGSGYVNLDGLRVEGIRSVTLRYDKLRKVVIYTIKD
jgi:hypothetical protein